MSYIKQLVNEELLKKWEKELDTKLLTGLKWVVDTEKQTYLSYWTEDREPNLNNAPRLTYYQFLYKQELYLIGIRPIEVNGIIVIYKIYEITPTIYSQDDFLIELSKALTYHKQYGDIDTNEKISDKICQVIL